MDDHPNENAHVIFAKFEKDKKCKEQILQEIKVAVCATLNSNGGKVEIRFHTDSSIPVESIPFSQIPAVIRILEQRMIATIGSYQTVSKVDFRDDKDSIMIFIKKADSLLTVKYNLYLPTKTQVVEVSPLESHEKVKEIINRKAIPNPVKLGSHCQTFGKGKNCEPRESKTCQLKNVKAGASKRTTLADRMTGKGNKFSCYVSAFANHKGGHIYYGIADDRVVEGEFIPNEKDKKEITKKVEKAINKMIWPEQIGEPKRGEHWEIFFEPVVDANAKPVPSTFVIVIYIAPCLGGVFTEEPECYKIVKGKVQKMGFAVWKKAISQPIWLRSKEAIPHSVPRVTWSSAETGKIVTDASEEMRKLINDGNWRAISKLPESLQKQSHNSSEMKLVILSKQVTSYYRRGNFNRAFSALHKYMDILPGVKDFLIFKVVGLHIEAALKRATGDLKVLEKVITEALLKAEMIEPGPETAAVYAFAATVSGLITLGNEFSPDVLATKTLEHLDRVKGYPHFCADKAQKAHMVIATCHLACNFSGQPIKDHMNILDLNKAKANIIAVHDSILEGNPLSRYREVQFKLVQSIYHYRHAQVSPADKKVDLLRNAFNHANEAERLAIQFKFREIIEWSKESKALCTEELVQAKLLELKLPFTIR